MSKLTQDELNRMLRAHALWRAGNPKGRRIDLRYRDLSGLSFAGADCTYALLTDANLANTNFAGTNCTRANFTGADLTCTDFTGTNCTRANFTGADLTCTDFTGANFTGAELIRANFTNATFTGADFTNAWCSPRDAHHIGYMGDRDVYLHNTLNVAGVISLSRTYIRLNPTDVTPAEREYLQLLAATFAG